LVSRLLELGADFVCIFCDSKCF